MSHADLLIELGTEELPPKALKNLSDAFTQGIIEGLEKQRLSHGQVQAFASPRRLALLIEQLAEQQPDSQNERRGPALSAAFDDDGQPTKAALGFAKSCGVDIDQLERLETQKGAWLYYQQRQPGQASRTLVADIIEGALAGLPIPKRMRWGASRAEFVRPVQWLCVLLGNSTVECHILDQAAGNQTRGHRYHCNQSLTLKQPSDYERLLETQGYVIPSFSKRKEKIRKEVSALAQSLGGEAVIDEDLLDEVCGLVEWPVVLSGRFEERFLTVASEALVSSMKEHQKYFHMLDGDGNLMPRFITVANLESQAPDKVIEGNEKVIRPRLADAAFFWDTDRKQSLASRYEKLASILWVNKLGSLKDKSARIAELGAKLATPLGGDPEFARRAAKLCKTDLVSQMVYEFDDLQGIAGYYYALNDGEPAEVAEAMKEQYKPAFAGDGLPQTPTGMAIALADRLDSLVGLFGLGQIPSGTKDPYALRRASLGVLRILVEQQIDLDLKELIGWAFNNAWPSELKTETPQSLLDYMLDRFASWYQDKGITGEIVQAVRLKGISNPFDFNRRVEAVADFQQLTEAQSLAAANKRVSNILSKEPLDNLPQQIDQTLLKENAEQVLAQKLAAKQAQTAPLFAAQDYTQALKQLADLKQPVDDFFDQVMVMADDPAIKTNRCALLAQLRQLFLQVADISALHSK